MMKKLVYILPILFCFSCTKSHKVEVEISNTLSFDRSNELVELSVSELEKKISPEESETFIIQNDEGKVVPSQVTYDNKLIFQSELKANESKTYTILIGKEQTFDTKTSAVLHPERYDDFVWENDKIGFRVYGQALMKIQSPMSGFDLWYKRTNKIILDEWYRKELSKEASYHVDHGEGCDPYLVGQTLGAGNMAILVDSTIILNENYSEYEILDNGPLRSTFTLTYPIIVLDGQDIIDTKTISLDAGSQLSKVVQFFGTDKPLTVAAGFPKRAKNDSILYTKGNDYFVYEELTDSINGQIYLGILIPEKISNVYVNKYTLPSGSEKAIDNLPNVIATSTYTPEKTLTYYTGFGWSKYGFKNAASFATYMKDYSASLSEPLKIKYK